MYKCIEGGAYTIYIAIPYNTSVREISDTDILLCSQDTSAQAKDAAYSYRRYECPNEYVSEYAVSLDNNIVYVLASTTSKSIADSLFSHEAMKERLVLE